MRIFDRYVVKQLLPAWVWCLIIFLFLSCLIDMFGHLDEILRYKIPPDTVLIYYACFMPMVFVQASPIALLFATSFISTRLTRYQEFLAINASGTSPLRVSLPFLFVGWIASICVFAANETIVPMTTATYERIKVEAFRDDKKAHTVDNVALLDNANRLYHARELNLDAQELADLTVLEHDWRNRPTKSLYSSRAIWTKHGWLLLYGTIYRMGQGGRLRGEPQPFVERLIPFPVSPHSFLEPEAKPETMRYGQLRSLIERLEQTGITHLRRQRVELASKLSMPFLNLIVCFLAFVASTQPALRGNLKGLGMSLAWGIAFYIVVAACYALTKQWPIPIAVGLWMPYVAVSVWCVMTLQKRAG